jgi:glycosyltransferase involved in cell wall biosynthesis
MTKVLWLAPNFNHYKARFLNHLAMENPITLEILSGTGRSGFGDKDIVKEWDFNLEQLAVTKKKFGFSSHVRKVLKTKFRDFDWILIPAEKKNLPLFLFAIWLRSLAKKKGLHVRLFSYNHPVLKSGKGRVTKLDIWLSKFYYKHLDRTIFYTEQSCAWAISEHLIKKENAYWANNTIDTVEINSQYAFCLPEINPVHILFIGRLIPSKKINIAIEYFQMLQQQIPEKELFLEIIGDGPESHIVKAAMTKNKNINWYGALVEESEIAPIMKQSACVFLPGDSGLSINHAFAYGRPYITFESKNHGPEISYVTNFKNGMILNYDEKKKNIELLTGLVNNAPQLQIYCENAKRTGEELSVQNWVGKIKSALLDD